MSALASPVAAAQSDAARLAAVDRYDILDTRPEQAFDRISRLIRLTLEVDIGLVSLMDAHRQWYKSIVGLDGAEAPLDLTFCRHMLADGLPLMVPDATLDSRFRDNPFVVGDPNVRAYAGVPLRTADGFTIGSICAIGSTAKDFTQREQTILLELAGLAMDELELRQTAAQDSLTQAGTRRAFKEEAQRFVALAKRHLGALSCISFDLDHFKTINDTYGHAAGDQVLVSVAHTTAAHVRQTDLFGRLGGEEFAILLPHTDQARAVEVAEKLRLLFRGLSFPGSHPPLSISASFGVATLDPAHDDVDALLQKADEALYAAKRTGRNKCAVWQSAGHLPQHDRRRVLKAGKLVLNDQNSVINGTVRALWADGAEISLSTTLGIPETLILRIPSDSLERRCIVTERTEQKLTLAFLAD